MQKVSGRRSAPEGDALRLERGSLRRFRIHPFQILFTNIRTKGDFCLLKKSSILAYLLKQEIRIKEKRVEEKGGRSSMVQARFQWAGISLNSSDQVLLIHCGSDGKESACSAGDLGSIPGSGRVPGEGNGYPLHYSCLENPMDRGAWRATVHGIAKIRT